MLLLLVTLALPQLQNIQLFGGWQAQGPAILINISSTRRGHVFYKGEVIALKLSAAGASRYVLRDYYGNTVEQGLVSGTLLAPSVREPGWYKVDLYGGDQGMPFGTSVGSGMFSIIRDDPNFPKMPAPGTYGGDGLIDEVTRGVFGYGPQRHKVDNASNAANEIPRLDAEIALDQQYYLPFDPYRKRDLLIAFPNGTSDLAGVRLIVDHFKGVVRYWEPRNEPNFGASATGFVQNELAPFYQTVKSVDPTLKVIAPGAVTVGPPMAGWNDEFFRAGGGKYIDVFSFHAYNCVNGDLGLIRTSMDQVDGWLKKYNLAGIEKWQTEQGYLGPVYGAYQPRMQGRWSMLQMMVYEQYGIPKEHNHYWYDRSGGFWDEPRWVQNEDGSINPVGPLLRVWAEELYGTRFASALNFGNPGNKLFVGSLFNGPGKQVATIMTSGDTRGQVVLNVTGATSVKVVSPFGTERTLPVVNGVAVLPVSELPTYVEYAGTLTVPAQDWGTNLALQTGVTAAASGSAVHPIDPAVANPPSKVINGKLDTWYWNQTNSDRIWEGNNSTYPAWFEVRLPAATQIDRVVIYAGIPWQWDGSILDYELQVDQAGQWVSLERVKEPATAVRSYTQTNRTTIDSYYSERCVFTHSFAPVTTAKIRLLVNDVTWGGALNKDLKDAGSQGGEHQLNLREIEVYRSGIPVVVNQAPVAAADSANCSLGASVTLPVLANDTNPSGGPYPLSLVSVSAPTLGTAAIQGDKLVYTASKTISGTDQFTYTVTNGATTASGSVTVKVSSVVQPPGPDTNGLMGEYYNNADFTAFVFNRIDPYIDANWGIDPPDPAMQGGSYSVRWTGKVRAKYSELYTFTTLADDGVRLWVDGKLLVDNWATQAGTTKTATIQLVAGQQYDLKVEYFQGGGGSRIMLQWNSLSQPLEVVPYGALTLGASVTVVPAANKAPVAVNDTAWTTVGISTLVNVLANDVDPDAGPSPLNITAISTPARGSATLVGSSIQYTPAVGFSGVDVFNYTISDGALSATATVSVTVAAPDPTRLSGLKAEYFSKMDLTSPILTRLDANVNFDWLLGSPAPSVAVDGFSVRWSGAVTARYTEAYTFFANTDDGVRVWVNGVNVIDNWTDHAATEVSGTINLVAGQLTDLRMEYYENSGGAVAQLRWSSPRQAKEIVPTLSLSTAPFTGTVTPPPVLNKAPLAVDDAAATNEGVAVKVAVLANDSDPDSGPAPLSVSAVAVPAHGSATVVAGGVSYQPATGFYGVDRFGYTITDGSATATATVSVTVNSTAKAYDLVSAALASQLIGASTGSSRVLADGSWELNGAGVGMAGVSDAVRFESAPATGNFLATLRVRSVTGSAAARTGVLLREGGLVGDRCVLAAVTPSSQYRTGVRLAVGGAFAETTPAGADAQVVAPEGWMQLERIGDVVRVLVSSDGASYRPVAVYTLSSLASTVQLGVFASSGSSTATATGIVDQWSRVAINAVGAPPQRGLFAVYFATSTLTTPAVARVEDTVNYDWANSSPHPAIAGDNFSARWTGRLVPPATGTYTFYTQADDGVRLWVNGVQVVNDWNPHALTESSGTIALQAGVSVDVKLEYFEAGGQAACKLLWAGPGIAKQVVPVAVLRPAVVANSLGSAALPTVNILADGVRELTATGGGLKVGSTEQGGYLNQPRSGDFQMAVRIRSLTGAPATAIMLREGFGAGDRFAALQLAANGSLSVWSRTTVGGAVSSVAASGSLLLPNAWLLVERRGDQISLAISADDITYTNVTKIALPGLSQMTYAGAFLGGGSGTVVGKAVLGDCEVTPISSAGLTGEYFGGIALSGQRLTRVDPTVDFNWGALSPDPSLPADNFSARWTGRVKTSPAGTYTFAVQSDDGVRLWLNGQLVVNNWTDHATTETSVSLVLGAGVWVDLRMEYYERAGGAVARLLWTPPGQAKQVIPAAQMQTP
ncbi:MAG: PA14 domain-containing protein [Verrucomicrobia bacterium]|nr:MAG: PA14 domain-containing protein [Verrucomicrobiota bacterium]